MMRWIFLLGGLLVWGLHFGAVYGLASIGAVAGDAEGPWVRLGIAAVTLLGLVADAACLSVALVGWRPAMPPGEADVVSLWRTVGGVGAAVSFAAVMWQGLPALLS